jgi:two-component system sensor histidine kinase KdpD
MRRLRPFVHIAASMAGIGVVTALYLRLAITNPTTIALSYVVVILIIAGRWGIVEATVAALTAVLCFNFFFLMQVTIVADRSSRRPIT